MKGALRREFLSDPAALAPERGAAEQEAIFARILLMPEVRDARGILVCISFADDTLHSWLHRDHEEIDESLSHATERDRLDQSAFDSLRERLLRHIGIEERLLFPAAKERGTPELRESLAALRVEHAALTSLLVQTPDVALVAENRRLLQQHNHTEEVAGGIYEQVIDAITDERAHELLLQARARGRVPVTSYFDGPGTVRTAADALAKASRARTRTEHAAKG